MNNTVSTPWTGPVSDAWDAAADQLQSWADSIDWAAYAQAEAQYLAWAAAALTELTAYANELPDAELAALRADMIAHPNHPGRPKTWCARYSASRLVEHTSVRIVDLTQGNLAQLKKLGTAARDVGLAAVAQGLIRDPEVTEFLAGPWIRRGHPFPRTGRVSFDDFSLTKDN
ncbi:hypothetical protein OHB13_38315 (plasmid) [Streptomyces sp. NBC_00440]|uniref:hypothetical protein n=1 Tax=Streptomyces sp. NBC_00440 TaxID=2975741 RepID=UPI002E20ADA4